MISILYYCMNTIIQANAHRRASADKIGGQRESQGTQVLWMEHEYKLFTKARTETMPRRNAFQQDDWDDDDTDAPEAWADNGVSDNDDSDDDDSETYPCPHCHHEIHEETQRCPYCEAYISAEDAPRQQPLWIIIGVSICLAIVGVWIFFS